MSIYTKELRRGNYLYNHLNEIKEVDYIGDTVGLKNEIGGTDKYQINPIFSGNINDLKPIPLSEDILLKCGANKSSIENPFFSHFDFHFSRNRHISVSNPGTPNEMVMLVERKEGKQPTVIVLRNYDYDGKTYLHDLQNIFHSASKGQELKIEL